LVLLSYEVRKMYQLWQKIGLAKFGLFFQNSSCHSGGDLLMLLFFFPGLSLDTGIRFLRPILNFAPRGKLWPPGAKLSPRSEHFVPWGWSYPMGVKFSVGPSILLNST
jgi:hypothetical protein